MNVLESELLESEDCLVKTKRVEKRFLGIHHGDS